MLKITIITVCYNEGECLRKTVESVCKQTYSNIEYVVIDGGSSDETLDVLCEYSNFDNLKFYSEDDFGIYNAMNRGISRANGDYIYFINAGDKFYNDYVIENVVSYIGKETDTIYYGKVCCVFPDGLNQIQDYSKDKRNLQEKLLDGYMPCHQAIFAPKKWMINHYFREIYKIRADYEWFVYSIKSGCKCKNIPLVISFYDMTGMSSRMNNTNLFQEEEKEILKEYQGDFFKDEINYVLNIESKEKLIRLKYEHLFQLMSHWLALKQRDINIGIYLKQKGYKNIAIYGMSHIGFRLLEEFKNYNIEVNYAIDKNENIICEGLKIISPDKNLEKVDAVIVTAVNDFYEIKEKICDKVDAAIISLEDLIYGLE